MSDQSPRRSSRSRRRHSPFQEGTLVAVDPGNVPIPRDGSVSSASVELIDGPVHRRTASRRIISGRRTQGQGVLAHARNEPVCGVCGEVLERPEALSCCGCSHEYHPRCQSYAVIGICVRLLRVAFVRS